MEFLRELLQIDEAKKEKSVSSSTAHNVYHRDYLRTRNKPYRKYKKEKVAKETTND